MLGEIETVSPELVLARLDQLPTLAPIAVRLLQATADVNAELAEIAALLRADPSLAARVLSLANSSALGTRSEVRTIDQAVVRLGFKTLRCVVLTTKVFEAFDRSGRGDGLSGPRRFEPREFWKHALATACAARRMAEAASPKIDADAAFLGGLLHDLGKIALSAVYPKTYERVATQAEQMRADVTDCERAVLGTDHTVAGRRLAERWRLPAELRDTIWLHHLAPDALPRSVANPRLIALVQAADALAREQRIGWSGNFVVFEAAAPAAERLGIAASQFASLSGELAGDVSAYCALLGLDRETPEAIYVQALSRANNELGRLNWELTLGQRRLASAARCFRALSALERPLNAWSDLAAIVSAAVEGAQIAFQCTHVAAFGLHDDGLGLELSWINPTVGERGRSAERTPPELLEWVRARRGVETSIEPLPAELRTLITGALPPSGDATAWLLPISLGGDVIGGFALVGVANAGAAWAEEADELRSFVASVALSFGRANAQAAARRLSDDLAQTNRRLQQVQVEILRNRTLAMIAEMAAGAGHELNGPLTVISGRAQMLMDALEEPELARSLELIHQKAHECSRIVTELMDFARPHPPERSDVTVSALLEEARQDALEAGWPAQRISVAPPTESADARLHVDRAQVRRVLAELLSNARDATSENGGRVVLEWRRGRTLMPPLSSDAAEARTDSAPWCEITVRDSGCGMAPAVLQRAFDPFYSHRTAGRRRGLGLARAFRIIEAHGGRIWLESRVNEGTAAHLLLPLAT